MKPKTLKSWEFVKNERFDISRLRSNERPEDFYYQFDGYTYYPAVYKMELDLIPEKK
jgi:hypothetical protein